MEIKFVVFVVSTILSQTSAASTSNSTADRNKMLLNQESTLRNGMEAFELMFDRVVKLTVEHIYNDTPSTNYNTSVITATSLRRMKDAVDFSLNNTLTTAGRTSCDAVKQARSRCYLGLERIWANITEAIAFVELSKSENTNVSENLAEYRTKVRNEFNGIVQAIVRTVINCAEVTSIEELQVIRIYSDRMQIALHKATNSMCNGIRYLAYAHATESPDLRIVQLIDQEKVKANVAVTDTVESAFTIMEVIYINKSENRTDVFADLAETVYTEKFANYRFKGAVDALFTRVDGYLFEESLSFAEAGEEDFSLDDAVKASVDHQWRSGTLQFLSSFNSDNSTAVSEYREELSTIIAAVAVNFANQLHLAKMAPEESDNVPQIDNLNAKATTWAVKYCNVIYEAMLNGKNITPSLQTSKTNTETQMKIFMDSVSKAYKVLAQVVSKSMSVDDANVSVNRYKRRIYSAVSEITQSVSNARLSIVSNS